MKIANILVFSLILILLSPVAFASSDNSTSDTNINENSDYKNTCENMNIERFRDPIDNDFIDVNTTVYESEYNSQQMKSPTIQSSDLTKYYHNASQFQATFFNSNHDPLINTDITFKINGQTYTKTTNNQGIASIGINLRPGIYYITSTNPLDSSSVINKVTVLSTIIGDDIVKYYRNETQYRVTILNGQGNPIANVNVNFNINGVIYTRITNSNGCAILPINLNPGTYIVTVTNPNDNLNMSNTITVLSTIVADTMVKFKSETKAFEARILNGQGNPKSNTNVQFNINGMIYTKTTDSNGIAKININLNPNQYIITVIENGLSLGYNIYVYHDMVHKYTNPLLIPITKNIQKGGIYEVKLSEDNGLPIPNKNIQLTINSATYTATTNNQGIAKFTLNLNPGTYSVKSSYGSLEKTRTLIVNPVNNGIETIITPLTTTLWTNNPFKIELKNKNTNAPLSNQNIIFYVNGVEYTKTTDSNGIASINIRFQKSNIYPITASFAGTTTGTLYKPTNTYKLFYIANNEYDSNYKIYNMSTIYGNYMFSENDWNDPTTYLQIAEHPTNNIIADVNNDYIIKLSNYLTIYNDKLENVISINSYVSSINYEYYVGTEKTALNTLLSFSGNCVDQTNIFVSLSRIAGYGSRYIPLNHTYAIGHEIGQILIDTIWITVDNSAATLNNGIYTKMSECRYLGNKDYLFQNNYKIGGYVPVYYGNNSYLIFESNNDNHSNLIMSPKLEKYSYNQVTEKFKIMN
ncbi:transglutaminase domain-containing protein [Methanobrevibacter smithii]|uniref:transglutaminase domain-containing protein n=1 Tax=Methanobrevibacter smithii TaxID=2173 RepID=UPI0037DDA0FE